MFKIQFISKDSKLKNKKNKNKQNKNNEID
jgi:hypothetical protein